MATELKDEIAALGDRALRKRIKQETKVAREIEAADDREIVSSGRAGEVLSRLQSAGAFVAAAEQELRAREVQAMRKAAPRERAWREKAAEHEQRKAELAPAQKALSGTVLPPGVTNLDPTRLTASEGQELYEIHVQKELSPKQQARWEALVEKAGGPDAAGVFERQRQERALAEKRAKIAEQERLATLPQRPAPPRGSVLIPGYMVNWLTDRQGSLDAEKLGTLTGVLLGLENRLPSLAGARIEDVDGEPVMVVPAESLRFPGGNGSLGVTRAIDYLAKNKLLRVERRPEGLRIGAGERMKKLHGGGDEDGS